MVDRQPHAVYHLYDSSDQLLYVGCTHEFSARMKSHRKRPWGKAITRAEVRYFNSLPQATAYEAQAIADDNPLFNVTHVEGANRQPNGARIDAVMAALQAGPATQHDLETLFGNENKLRANAWVGTVLTRLFARGDITVVGHRPALGHGRHQQARIYGLPTVEQVAS